METVQFAVIGAGNIGKTHVRAMQGVEQARVTVVCNRSGRDGKELANSVGADWVDDYHAVLQRDDVNALAICTPSGAHGEIAIAAARAGKHVLIEKPLEINLPRIDAVLEAAHANNITLSCIFQSRMRQGVRAARQALHDGRLGKLIFANAFVPWHRPPDYYANNWRGTLSLDGGGALMNQSIHSIDLLQWLAGDVASIFAHTATRVHDIEGEDTASALLTFANGAQGVIQGSTSLRFGRRARIELLGSAGNVILEEGRLILWNLQDASAEEEERMLNLEQVLGTGSQDPTAIDDVLHQEQIDDFVAAILQGRPPAIPGAEARKAVEIIRAIYRSAQDQQLVTMPYQDDLALD